MTSRDMATHRLRRWRCGLVGVVVWAMLATAAALEEYDEVSDGDSRTYHDDNTVDTRPVIPRSSPDLALAKDMLLYRLFKSFQSEDQHLRPRYRPHWTPEYQEARHTVQEDSNEKDAVVKRLTDALRMKGQNLGYKSFNSMYRPQQKWKIKKGSQMVCYFKLCAFRSPV